MKSSARNRPQRLFDILFGSWAALFVIGLAIRFALPIPTVTLLLDRSYCPPEQWKQVSQAYGKLYRQHQQKRSRLQTVIFFSSLGHTVLKEPPSPDAVEALTTYGQSDPQRQADLEKTYLGATVISCQQLP